MCRRFLCGHELRNVDYRDFPFSILRTHRPRTRSRRRRWYHTMMTLMFAPSLRHEDVILRRIILLPGSLSVARPGPSG